MSNHKTITPAAAFVWAALEPMAVPAYGRGLSTVMTNDQDAAAGFSAWRPPV
ncbi:MAG: hypothetical protein ACJ735_08935 [Actinomycetes bacterium]